MKDNQVSGSITIWNWTPKTSRHMRQVGLVRWFLLHPNNWHVRFLTITMKPNSKPAPKTDPSTEASGKSRWHITIINLRQELMLGKAHSKDEQTSIRSVLTSSDKMKHRYGRQDFIFLVDVNKDFVAVCIPVATTPRWHYNHGWSRNAQLKGHMEVDLSITGSLPFQMIAKKRRCSLIENLSRV